jgi:plastocyanin
MVLVVIPPPAAQASGGGGCGGPVTNESGTEIQIDTYCFAPTVLYADPGDTVTWTNLDRIPHNVAGANSAWGSFESFRRPRKVSYSFTKPGVYSYVCTIHPGMVGTVVIGDPAPGGTTASNSVKRIKHVSVTQNEPVSPEQTSEGAGVWIASALAIAGLGSLFVGRRVGRRLRA